MLVLRREVDDLKARTLSLGGLVEKNLQDAVTAFRERDARLGGEVIAQDEEIDRLEVDIEEECLKLLALHQPVAGDLRFIVAVVKLTNDLERIGDLAVDIAERAIYLSDKEVPPVPYLDSMPSPVQRMVKLSLDSLVNLDANLAREVCQADDEVDELHRNVFARITTLIEKDPDATRMLIAALSVARYLERAADHATNIAEDVIYLVEGQIVRHDIGRPAEDELQNDAAISDPVSDPISDQGKDRPQADDA